MFVDGEVEGNGSSAGTGTGNTWDDRASLERLAETRPGAELSRVLEAIDRADLAGDDLVRLLKAWNRQVAHAQAELYATMAAVLGAEADLTSPHADPSEWHDLAASEIRSALTWTRRAAEAHLDLAVELADRHRRVWEALHRGEIDLPKARVIIEQTISLDPEPASRVAEAALQTATRETTGELRARIRSLVIGHDPDAARARYEQAVLERRVVQESTNAGTANLMGLDLPVDEANAAMQRLDRLAHRLKAGGDRRPIDQIRADLFLDLLNGRMGHDTKTGGGVVDIRVDLTTLAELDDRPAEIPGWGPVIADIARKVAEDDAEWRVTVTEDGIPRQVFTTRRRPGRAQRRRVEAEAATCVFPGCRMPASKSDIDHRVDWAKGGETRDHNLAPLCRHDHRLKHAGWMLQRRDDGTYLWTSPLGLKYSVDPRAP